MTDEPTVAVARRPRSYAWALGLLAVGAALLFLASGRTWATVDVADPGLPSITVAVTGSELTFGQPLALVALAGIAGLIALGRAGRIAAGVVLVLCALPALLGVIAFGTSHDSTLGAGEWIVNIVRERTGVGVSPEGVAVTSWWLVELVGVLMVVVAGGLAIVASAGWPRLGRRYERDAPQESSGTTTAAAAGPATTWDQLDAGVDPTLDGPEAAPRPRDATNPPT